MTEGPTPGGLGVDLGKSRRGLVDNSFSAEGEGYNELLFESKYALLHERLPHGEKIRLVDSEHLNRDAGRSPSATQRRPCPLEVFVPQIDAWMEEPNQLPRVWFGSRDVRTFVPIAVKASNS
jgi:hypothetical protein